jgi:Tfp pilus assembly protein PilO
LAKLTETQKSLAIFAGGVVLAIACGVGIYFDLGTIEELDQKILAQQKLRGDNQKEIDKIPSLEKDLVAYKKIVTDNAKILPTEADINAFIRDLSTLEKESGISILTLPTYNPITTKEDSSITRFPMKMSIKASTRSFLRFLSQLEGRERLVSVTDFRINPGTEDTKTIGQDLEHDVTMNFDLYRYDPTKGRDPKTFPIKTDKELQLLESKDVKDIVANKGRPANLERYQLLPGRDNRRDIFVDPRRRTVSSKTGPDGDNIRTQEETVLESLKIKLEHCRIELDSYRNAEQSKDFLRMAATKRSFAKSREELEEDLRKVQSSSPEFKSRDLQDRYLAEVKRPYELLMKEADFITPGTGPGGPKFTETMAEGMRKDLQEKMDKRMFREAAESWNGVDSFARDSGKTGIEEAAKPHIDAMRVMGEHAQFQAMLAEKKIVVQGVIRMERGSAAILNGKTLFPGKNFDKDTVFVRVDEGPKGEGDRLIFKIQGHEVDLVQSRPQLLGADKALLGQDDK